MKIKTVCRAFGVFETSLAGYLGYFAVSPLYRVMFEYREMFEDAPVGLKIVSGTGATICLLISTFAAADGLTDIVKGTHHYLLAKTHQKLTRSEEGKMRIAEEIEKMERIKDQDFSFSRRKDQYTGS